MGLCLFLRELSVEEKHVRLHALRVKDARVQAQQGVNVGLEDRVDGLVATAGSSRMLCTLPIAA
jgi:hypothetical protein